MSHQVISPRCDSTMRDAPFYRAIEHLGVITSRTCSTGPASPILPNLSLQHTLAVSGGRADDGRAGCHRSLHSLPILSIFLIKASWFSRLLGSIASTASGVPVMIATRVQAVVASV